MGGLTRTRARIELTVLKTFFAGEASTTFLFRILILSSMSGALVLRARVAIITGLVGDVLVGRRGSNSAGAGGWTGGLYAACPRCPHWALMPNIYAESPP